MVAAAEGEMRVRRPLETQLRRLVEDIRVEVRGADERYDYLAPGDLEVSEIDGLRRHALHHLDRTVQPEQLLDSAPDEGGVAGRQPFTVIGPVDQPVHGVADHVRSRLVAGDDEEEHRGDQLLLAQCGHPRSQRVRALRAGCPAAPCATP